MCDDPHGVGINFHLTMTIVFGAVLSGTKIMLSYTVISFGKVMFEISFVT